MSDGSWTGMIGMVHRGYAELALGPFTVTERREAACDMSVPVAHDYKGLFMVRPGIQSDMGAFLNPFAPLVWLMILVSMGAVSVAMMSLMWMEANVFTSTTRPQHIASHSIMWAVQTLSQESSDWLPRRTEGRLLVTTWLLASLVFMSSYSGILTAMLTVPRVTIPIDSISDLVSQSRLPWRFEGGSSMYQYFQDATDELRQQVFKDQEGVFKDCWEDKQAIADGQYVAICDETTMRKAMSWDFSTTGKCHMYIAREKIISVSSAIAFKTNSTYLPKANQMGGGLLDKWVSDHITNTSQCLRPPSTDGRDGTFALDMESLGGLFLFLAGAYLGTTPPEPPVIQRFSHPHLSTTTSFSFTPYPHLTTTSFTPYPHLTTTTSFSFTPYPHLTTTSFIPLPSPDDHLLHPLPSPDDHLLLHPLPSPDDHLRLHPLPSPDDILFHPLPSPDYLTTSSSTHHPHPHSLQPPPLPSTHHHPPDKP
ncbi:hypothetical protein Pcinc_018979 [Petrolisthes cinctipes]|uniref:Ionotropic glutamate receptor C-terminal domain-containing protein n=1 Tax=Petrolisthes cinctipes TaxID=88211 RepID=A0AAE1FL50_PETCI|nr:hypothetical protein Pcinc_018979 [Petrolisthes cinctipes]